MRNPLHNVIVHALVEYETAVQNERDAYAARLPSNSLESRAWLQRLHVRANELRATAKLAVLDSMRAAGFVVPS